jgi:hypothetical protein
MKSVKSLLAIFIVAVLVASCTTTQNTSGENYDENDRTRRVGNRVYVEDPFYGTVILERNPFTGRYHDVTYGNRSFSSPYNSWNNYRRYGNNNRIYRNNNGGNVQRPSREQQQPNREEARKKILGDNRN